MKKTACILSLFTFIAVPCAAQYLQKAAQQTALVQRNLARATLRSYVAPQVILETNPIKLHTIEQSLHYKPRPIDKVRHSIAPSATTVLGSEKMVFSVGKDKFIPSWRKQYREKYYTPAQREKLKNLLTTTLNDVRTYKPDMKTISLDEYINQYVTNGTSAYLVPMYRSFLRAESLATKNALPYITGAAFSVHEERLERQRLSSFSEGLLQIISASAKLLQFLPNDPYLKAVNSFYVGVYQVFNPQLASLVGSVKLARPDGRIFNWHEFFLFDSNRTDYTVDGFEPWSEELEEETGSLRYLADKAATQSAQLLKNLPQDLHIAILNDDEKPLANFQQWAQKGYLGAQAKVSVFEDGEDLIKSIESGAHYNLIITDIHVPNGGRAMMPALRKLVADVPVFAMSKEPRQKVGALNLFDIGMDGYIPYTTVLNDEHVGYWEFLRALTNYMSIRKPNWIR